MGNNNYDWYVLSNEEQEKVYPVSKEEKEKWMIWVPSGKEITNAQIYDAKERGIPIPTGDPILDQEYLQFLSEHVLKNISEGRFIGDRGMPVVGGNIDGGNIYNDSSYQTEHSLNNMNLSEALPSYLASDYSSSGFDSSHKEDTFSSDIRSFIHDGNLSPSDEIDSYHKGIIVPASDVIRPYSYSSLSISDIDDKNYITTGRKSYLDNTMNFSSKINDDFSSNIPFSSKENDDLSSIIYDFKVAIDRDIEKDESDKKVKVVEKKKSPLAKILATIAILVLLIPSLKLEDVKEIVSVPIEKSVDNLNYEFNYTYDDVMNTIINRINLGDKIYLSDGMTFNTNSRNTGITKTLGQDFSLESKFAGNYAISGFSIVDKESNEVINAVEDFYNVSEKINLAEFIRSTLKEKNMSFDDIRISLHFGVTTDDEKSRLGWIDLDDVLTEDTIEKYIIDTATYTGVVENFNADHVIINTSDGEVKIPVKNSDGSLLSSGSEVMGSNGKKYKISNLNITTTSEVEMERSEVITGSKLLFEINDVSLLISIPLMVAAVLEHLRSKKNNNDKVF